MKTPPVKIVHSLISAPNIKGANYTHPSLPGVSAEVIEIFNGEFDCFFYRDGKMLPASDRPVKSWGDANTDKETCAKLVREFLHAEAKKVMGSVGPVEGEQEAFAQ